MEEGTTREWVDIMEAIVTREGMQSARVSRVNCSNDMGGVRFLHSYQGHYFDTAVSNNFGCNLV